MKGDIDKEQNMNHQVVKKKIISSLLKETFEKSKLKLLSTFDVEQVIYMLEEIQTKNILQAISKGDGDVI